METIAIIAARAGSKGLARKNLLPLAGKPLLAHTIDHATSSGVCDVVLVTTEDEQIAAIARSHGAEVVMRSRELAQDLVPMEPVLQHALLKYEQQREVRAEIVIYLQTTDVFRTPELIRDCVERLRRDPSLDSVFAGYPTHKNFWRWDGERYVRVWRPDLSYGPRQTAQLLYREDTGIACATRAQLVREGRRIGPRVDIVPVDDVRASIDIHSAFDLWLAEKILTEWEAPDR